MNLTLVRGTEPELTPPPNPAKPPDQPRPLTPRGAMRGALALAQDGIPPDALTIADLPDVLAHLANANQVLGGVLLVSDRLKPILSPEQFIDPEHRAPLKSSETEHRTKNKVRHEIHR